MPASECLKNTFNAKYSVTLRTSELVTQKKEERKRDAERDTVQNGQNGFIGERVVDADAHLSGSLIISSRRDFPRDLSRVCYVDGSLHIGGRCF